MVRTNDSGTATARTRDTRLRAVSIAAVLGMVAALVLAGPSGTARAATKVGLGTAGSFAVLAGSTITNTGPTTITGDVGLHPGTAVTGFDSVTLHGELHVDDGVAEQAKADLVTAYNDAAGRSPTATVGTELGGQTLTGGVYDSESGTFEITGDLTLDAQGDPSTVWVFQTESTLITASDSRVSLINGADACNVFWQVGSSATLGTNSSFTGTIMALTSITLKTKATVEGRTLARNGAVTMDTNTITRVRCTTPTDESTDTTTGTTDEPTDTTTGTTDESTDTTTGTTDESTDTATGTTDESTDTTTGTTDESTDTATGTTDDSTDTSTSAGEPDASVAAAPPTSGTPQVSTVPTGAVSAGDGSMAIDERPGRATATLVLLPLFAALALYATWRRRKA